MKDNEPAFPQDRDEQGRIPQDWGVGGITVRDYFAAKALAAIIAIESDDELSGECHDAYLYADAMMKARNK